MATVVTPLTYRVASGQPVNAGRWPGGRVSGGFTMADSVMSGVFVANPPSRLATQRSGSNNRLATKR